MIGDLGKISGWSNTHLTGCIDEIIGFHSSRRDGPLFFVGGGGGRGVVLPFLGLTDNFF